MSKPFLFSSVAAVITLFGVNAIACPPPPPGPPQEAGESADAYAARIAAFRAEEAAQHANWLLARQQRLWDDAQSVIVARIDRVTTTHIEHLSEAPRVTLRPLHALKGPRRTARFSLTYREMTSCGPIPAFEAIRGGVGDTFVVFVRGGRLRQVNVLDAIAVDNIADPRIRAVLDAPR